MKILFLTNLPSPYRIDFFNEIGKKTDLTVVFERETASNRNIKWKSQKERYFKEVYLSGVKLGVESSFSLQIINYLKDKKYDVIVIGGYSSPTSMLAIQYLSIKKIDFYLSCDGGIIKNDNKLKYTIKQYFISKASYWLSSGEGTTNYLQHYGAVKEKIFKYPFTSVSEKDVFHQVIPNNQKNVMKNKIGIKNKKVVLSVGNFIYRKGYDILLQACKDLAEDVIVIIVGGKPTKEYMEIHNKLQLSNVIFLDFMSKKDLLDIYKLSDIFVLPTRSDIWGLVINEAMSAGLPVITTNGCVAGKELIKNGENGFIIETEDYNNLTKKINLLSENDELRNDIASNNIEKMKKYTIESMADAYLNAFYETVEE